MDAVRELLDRDPLPAVTGERRVQCRVAVNVLAMGHRELTRGQGGSLEDLNRELARRIGDGAIDLEREDLRDHLPHTMVDTLRVNNPRWLETGQR